MTDDEVRVLADKLDNLTNNVTVIHTVLTGIDGQGGLMQKIETLCTNAVEDRRQFDQLKAAHDAAMAAPDGPHLPSSANYTIKHLVASGGIGVISTLVLYGIVRELLAKYFGITI